MTQLDAKLMERGIVCAPGSVPTFTAAIAAVERVRFYSGKNCHASAARHDPHTVCICSLSWPVLANPSTYWSLQMSPAVRKA